LRNKAELHIMYNRFAYQRSSCDYESRSWRGVLDTTFSDKVYQVHRWFRLSTPNFLITKTDSLTLIEDIYINSV